MDIERKGGSVVTKMRLLSAMCALIAAVVVVWQANPVTRPDGGSVELRSTSAPMTGVSSTIKSPVLQIVNPRPFDPCQDIPLDVIQRVGLAFTPPSPEDALRCHYDAGSYQMAIEAFVWRTYEETIPADAIELDIAGHRAAQYWILKPSDRNNRFWFTCMVAFKTSYGVIQQSLFFSPTYSPDAPDCMQMNLEKAQQLAPYYKF